ncbi:MAG: DUF5320 family protein, partial [bacterium]
KKSSEIKGKEVSGMPGFDGTGPMGMGPMTGGGFGFCAPGARRGVGYPGLRGLGHGGYPWGGGRGFGWGGGRGLGRGWFGRGRGRGFRWAAPWDFASPWDYAPPTAAGEIQWLKEYAGSLEGELAAIRDRVSELESKGDK